MNQTIMRRVAEPVLQNWRTKDTTYILERDAVLGTQWHLREERA